MKELVEIVAAFDALCAAGKPAALATVIGVEGSAYRRPGARMLVAEGGRTWGGVSGGCLERDVPRRARGVIDTGRPVRCRYDTADDDAIAPGAATGCGGGVELFIQPLDRERPGPLLDFARVVRDRRPATLCTLVGLAGGASGGSAGERVAVGDGFGISPGGSTAPWLARSALAVASVGTDHGRSHLLPSAAGDVFVERQMPPQALVVFGAGPDVVPVVVLAKVLGWHVTVVGSRPATGLVERFAAADALHVTGSDDPVAGLAVPSHAAVSAERNRAVAERIRADEQGRLATQNATAAAVERARAERQQALAEVNLARSGTRWRGTNARSTASRSPRKGHGFCPGQG